MLKLAAAALAGLAMLVGTVACSPPGPAVGASTALTARRFVCSDQPSMQAVERAYTANDEPSYQRYFQAGACWIAPIGQQVRVLDHGTVTLQDGGTPPVTQLRLLGGDHDGQSGWILQPSGAL